MAGFKVTTEESIILFANRWKCPLTKIAEGYTLNRRANFDIYLPEWLAKHNVRLFAVLIVVEVFIVAAKAGSGV